MRRAASWRRWWYCTMLTLGASCSAQGRFSLADAHVVACIGHVTMGDATTDGFERDPAAYACIGPPPRRSYGLITLTKRASDLQAGRCTFTVSACRVDSGLHGYILHAPMHPMHMHTAATRPRTQVEFYFSDSNLPRDKFMSEKVAENEEGCELRHSPSWCTWAVSFSSAHRHMHKGPEYLAHVNLSAPDTFKLWRIACVP